LKGTTMAAMALLFAMSSQARADEALAKSAGFYLRIAYACHKYPGGLSRFQSADEGVLIGDGSTGKRIADSDRALQVQGNAEAVRSAGKSSTRFVAAGSPSHAPPPRRGRDGDNGAAGRRGPSSA